MTVVTFGEVLMRLASLEQQRLSQATSLVLHVGGAEANVAVSLACLGTPARLVTRLPDNALGQAALQHLLRHGVETSAVFRGGPRLGLYFLEPGAGQRPGRVIYDRAGSAFAALDPEQLDAEALLDGARWFHWTGITPALGEGPRRALTALCEAARERGAQISCDLNYRRTLWGEGAAREVMVPLVTRFADICVANADAARACLAARVPSKGAGASERLAAELLARFEGLRAVVVTRRGPGPTLQALLQQRGAPPSRAGPWAVDTVDRIGAGDAFAAGLIFALLQGRPAPQALTFALAAGCLKHTFVGDVSPAGPEEIERFAIERKSADVVR